jgi:hypothetical protein
MEGDNVGDPKRERGRERERVREREFWLSLQPTKKKKKPKQKHLVVGTEQSIEFEERIKWCLEEMQLGFFLSLSLSVEAFLPQIQGRPKTKSFGWRLGKSRRDGYIGHPPPPGSLTQPRQSHVARTLSLCLSLSLSNLCPRSAS